MKFQWSHTRKHFVKSTWIKPSKSWFNECFGLDRRSCGRKDKKLEQIVTSGVIIKAAYGVLQNGKLEWDLICGKLVDKSWTKNDSQDV